MTLFGEIDWSMIGDVGCAGGRWVIHGKPVQVVSDGCDIWGHPSCCPFFARDPVSFLRETQWPDNRGPLGRACVSVEWQVCVCARGHRQHTGIIMHLRVRRMCIRRCAWTRKTLYKKNKKKQKTLTCQPSVCILMKRKVRD